MRQILIIVVSVIVTAVNFMMYCCLRVASQEEQMLERLNIISKSDTIAYRFDKNNVSNH